MKYKVVGILDIFFGSIYTLVQLGFLLFTYPKLLSLYEDMGVQLPATTRYAPVFSGIFLLVFFGIIFVGVKLLRKPTDKLFLIGAVALVSLLIFSGYFVSVSILSVITPLYNITSSL